MLAIITANLTGLAQSGWGHMGGWGWGWWMGLAMIAFWAGVIWMIVAATRRTSLPPGPDPTETARVVLAERLARGEIDPAEYRDRLETLR